ncbi:transposase [Micromonospora sp. LZ34]
MKTSEQTGSELVHHLVPDELWELFRQIVPVKIVRRPQGGGRRRADDRQALAAIVYVTSTGRAWRQVPENFGVCWPTVYRRFAEWSQAHVWTRLLRLIADRHGERDDLNWSRQAIGAVCSRAAKDGP